MKHPSLLPPYHRLTAILSVLLTIVMTASAQQTSEPTAETEPAEDNSVVKLNPYTINEKNVVGWNSQMTFSGSRTAEELIRIPANISILTKDYLKDIGATNLLDILPYAASGVTQRVSYREVFTVRGFRQQKLTDGLDSFNYGFDPLYDIERIEIIKGPTALVFSNYGNVSGAINYVTKRPTSTPMGDASFTVGNYGLYIAQATQRGPLNANGSVRYRFTAGAQDSVGWFGRITPGAEDYNKNSLVSASVDWTATSKLEFRFDAGYAVGRMRDENDALLDPVTQKPWIGSVNGYNISGDWNYHNNSILRARAEAIYQPFSELTIRALYYNARQKFWFSYLDSEKGAFPGLQASEYPNYTVIKGMAHVWYERFPGLDNSIVDATWAHDFGGIKSRLNAGYNYDQRKDSVLYYSTPVADIIIAAPVSSRPGEVPQHQRILASKTQSGNGGWTAYAQEALSFFREKLLVTAGARLVSPSSNTLGKKTTVPSYGLLYRVTPGISVYAAKADSYTPQTGFDIFGNVRKDIIGKSKEVGLKFNALNERFFGTVDYFDILVDPVNRQIQAINPATGILIYGNAAVGKQTTTGVEADFGYVAKLGEDEWSTFVTYYSADPKTSVGLQPSSAVKSKHSLFTKFSFNGGALKGLRLGGGVSHVGGSPGVGFAWMDAYTTYSAFIGYQRKHWSLGFNADNLTNKKDILVGSEGTNFLQLAPPLNYRTTLSFQW